MKTSTLLLLGGAVAVGYWYAKRKSDPASGIRAQAVSAQGIPQNVTINVVDDDDYNYGPAWSWGGPAWGSRSWGGFRGGGGHGGHGGRHGGHGHGGHH
jgi:hypothetical protein